MMNNEKFHPGEGSDQKIYVFGLEECLGVLWAHLAEFQGLLAMPLKLLWCDSGDVCFSVLQKLSLVTWV